MHGWSARSAIRGDLRPADRSACSPGRASRGQEEAVRDAERRLAEARPQLPVEGGVQLAHALGGEAPGDRHRGPGAPPPGRARPGEVEIGGARLQRLEARRLQGEQPLGIERRAAALVPRGVSPRAPGRRSRAPAVPGRASQTRWARAQRPPGRSTRPISASARGPSIQAKQEPATTASKAASGKGRRSAGAHTTASPSARASRSNAADGSQATTSAPRARSSRPIGAGPEPRSRMRSPQNPRPASSSHE
jgi:hypothetical protein